MKRILRQIKQSLGSSLAIFGMLMVGIVVVVWVIVWLAAKPQEVDPLQRARVDGLTKEAFLCRYRNPERSLQLSHEALQYLDDSIPYGCYEDGRLRIWNNLAFGYYMTGEYDSSMCYINSLLDFEPTGTAPAANCEVEQVIARLLQARIMQRDCWIADSYQALYDVGRSGVLRRNRDNLLYNYAQTEYYITMLALNYNYRDNMAEDAEGLIAEVEEKRDGLRCDYAQDMALNYALAQSHARLLADTANQVEHLHKALGYCIDNLTLLDNPSRFCLFQFANTVEMLAKMSQAEVSEESNTACLDLWDSAMALVEYVDSDCLRNADYCWRGRLFEYAALCMIDYGQSPHGLISTVVNAGNHDLEAGDTTSAQWWFLRGLEEIERMQEIIAPKVSARLYEGLILSGCARSQKELSDWYVMAEELRENVSANEKADFLLQNELQQVKQRNRVQWAFSAVLAVLLLVLLVLLVLLHRRSKRLKQETQALQEAQRKDVERIANVETCLSVMRHDVTPFINYLQNKSLPEELRQEVLDQLLRTFDNIKHWTNLSIPSGLKFKGSQFALQEVFDSVAQSTPNSHPDEVALRFEPTTLEVQGDRLLMEILLRNLVSNAMKSTDRGAVVVSAQPAEGQEGFVQLSVQDSGCGMSEEQLEDLFRSDKKPAEQTNGGSGFGLILCRYIIKIHDDNTRRGCRIWAESTLGEGSTFHCVVCGK